MADAWIALADQAAAEGKLLTMARFGPEKALMCRRESCCTEGNGPGRCKRGDRGHDRDRAAFR